MVSYQKWSYTCTVLAIIIATCHKRSPGFVTTIFLYFRMANILIASDSRGRRLNQYIHNIKPFEQYKVSVVAIPGGTISTITDTIVRKITKIRLTSNEPIMVMFAAGICNLTNKIRHDGGCELDYESTPNKVQTIVSQFQNIYACIKQIDQNIKVKIATIPPASLKKYILFNTTKHRLTETVFSDDEIHQKQNQLEDDIKLINSAISAMNCSENLRTLRWDRDLMKTTIKKRGANGKNKKKITKFNYNHLYDGVHADSKLEGKWYRIMCESIKNDLQQIQGEMCSASDSSDDDNWDFKRWKNED